MYIHAYMCAHAIWCAAIVLYVQHSLCDREDWPGETKAQYSHDLMLVPRCVNLFSTLNGMISIRMIVSMYSE